ncbi:MAG TPA: hypothetical protein PLX89_05050 [Verrucomicrobiota bacterium]|nr:hypothetical protein [Verrucomicrobiota bacterium]
MNSMLKLSAVLVATTVSLNAAEITGKVTLKGTPPPAAPIPALAADPNCAKVAVGEAKSRVYVVGANGALANTVVSIKKGLEGKTFTPPEAKVEIDQAGCMYYPYVSAVMVGQKFDVKNSDPFMHNVNATPKLNKGFNFAQATKGQVNEKVFDKPELGVRFACNVHPWMIAYVNVMENPFFVVTDDKGTFSIKGDIPDGKYTLEAYHQKAGALTQEIEIKGGKATTDFAFDVK